MFGRRAIWAVTLVPVAIVTRRMRAVKDARRSSRPSDRFPENQARACHCIED
jgi:hypothetical protein